MAMVHVKGQFLGAKIDKKNFDGKETISVLLDIYQPDSPLKTKNITVKVDDVEMLEVFNRTYKFGSPIEVVCSINAYRNEAYYKLIDLVTEKAA